MFVNKKIKNIGLFFLFSFIGIISGCTMYGMPACEFCQLTPEQQRLVIDAQNKQLEIDRLTKNSE